MDWEHLSSNGICVSTFIFGCLTVPQSSNARTKILVISVIWNKPFFLTRGCPSFACCNFCFPAQQMVIHTPIAREGLRSRLTPTALMYEGYIHSYGPRPPGRIPAMLMKKSCYHVTFAGFCFESGSATRFVIFSDPIWFQAPIVNGSY